MKLLPLLGLLLVCSATTGVVRGEELQQLREGVHTPNSPASSSPAPSSGGSRDTYDPADAVLDDLLEDNPASEFLLGGIFMVAAAPYWAPYALLNDPDHQRFGGYTDAYAEGGYKDSELFWRSTDFVSSARAQLEYGTNFDDMQTVGSRLQIDLALWRLSLDSSWNNYYEDIPSGTDELALGDLNLVFRFAQNDYMQWRSGLGINWLSDTRSEVGFNFTYGFDILPVEPWIWSTDFDLGKLGHARLLRARTTLGVHLGKHCRDGELYTGFEYVDIEDAQIPQMLFGFRYWW
ncbi:hypothetical protein NG895_14540 [Aeoliella sp. ICT_H6.2]|uniref:Outer membrane protein with beta-barrel domain n=1 Tax=Aeoliella straminimaris TaxID=2954799 RepID=A0A9X2FG87_9BACT|nr:hypothetical protein [Aeoliella straminimaris]MCO6045126.1 hypothetical protein [Aeoliella straminimaris]